MRNYALVENKLLSVYRKVSPSYRKLDNKKDFFGNMLQRKNLLHELALPEGVFKGRTLIDIGGGTGEKSLFYALFGADVAILEPNEISCNRASQVFRQFGKKVKIITKSLFDINARQLGKYDIVVCDGVLHHTYDSVSGISLIIRNLKKDAIFLLGIGEEHGLFKRMLQRKLVFKLAGNNEEMIVQVAKKYFKRHIDRAVRFGMRSERSVIYDSYVNPQVIPVTLSELCDIFYKNKMLYHSAYPTLNFYYQTLPWSQSRENRFNYQYYKKFYMFLEKVWMTSGEANIGDIFSSFASKDISAKVSHAASELYNLQDKIDKLTFRRHDLRPIQYGYMGVGINYFVGVKL